MAVKFQVGAEIKTVPEKEEIDQKINQQNSQIAKINKQLEDGVGNASIDDTQASSETTYSSNKINEIVSSFGSTLDEVDIAGLKQLLNGNSVGF